MTIDFNALEQLAEQIAAKGPDFLKTLQDVLAKAEGSDVLGKIVPGLAGIEKEAQSVIDFLSKFEASILPIVIQVLKFLAQVFPAKAAA